MIGRCMVCLLASAVSAQPPAAEGRTRLLDGWESRAWSAGEYNSASGEARLVDDVPPAEAQQSRKAMQVSVHYSGNGFEAFGLRPPQGAIPGRLRQVSLWVKPLQEGYTWFLKFRGPKGEDKFRGRNMEFSLRGKAGQWTRLDFRVPEEWPQPLTITSLGGHNWSRRSVKGDAELVVDELRVTADLSGVDPAKTKLLRVEVACPRSRNLFVESESVEFSVHCDSWLGKPVTARLEWSVRDLTTGPWGKGADSFEFTDLHDRTIRLQPPRFGVSELEVTCRLSTGESLQRRMRLAYVPAPQQLSAAEKQASPWGINIHGGNPGVAYNALARCGFVWVRDYAYNFDWMKKARGADGKYAGWPWYPKMEARVKAAGLLLLPCLVGAIDRDAARAGKRVPDAQWRRDLLHILISFPQHAAWELDNEYDYKHAADEAESGWATYAGYHRVFGRAVHLIDEGVLAVEQGTAGVFPERVAQFVSSGAFADIDVVNCHHYCGTDPPESNIFNRNVGGENAPPRSFFDILRELATAAAADGKDRQVWLTEFGWDTLAGHIVPENVQAAYLQRGYLMGLQAGVDKLFWYWNRDTKDKPDNFFDGCGIWNPADEPKPAAAAAAALFRFLRHPQPLGMFDCGPNTLGYLFRDRGRLVGCAFTIEDGDPRAEVEFGSGRCFDMYGNPLPGLRCRLSPAPVWVVGLSEDDPLAREAVYSLQSRSFMRVTAGDTLRIECQARNWRRDAARASLRLQAPAGWETDRAQATLRAAAGATASEAFAVTVPDTEPQGQRKLRLVVREDRSERTLTTTVRVEEPVAIEPLRLTSGPAESEGVLRIHNRSNRARTVMVRATTPQSWRATPVEQQVTLAPSASTDVKLAIAWNADWQPGEVAQVAVHNQAGQRLAVAGIIPPLIVLPHLQGIVYDGRLDEWPALSRLPAWALGCQGAEARVEARVAYSDAGLHFAFLVRNSRVHVADPKLFWLQDAIEIFVDTHGDRQPRKQFAPTDHQFWVCPLVDERRAYLGRWKRFDETPATQYDIPGVSSFAGKVEDGYVIEATISRTALHDFTPRSGARIGLNINLTIQGRDQKREVYWPRPKEWSVLNMPNTWGVALLR